MMNQEDIFKKIGQILNELNDQYQYLAQNPRELNELELELFLANASFLSDHVQIARKLNNNVQKALPEHSEVADDFPVQESFEPAETIEVLLKPAAVHIEEPVEPTPVFELPVQVSKPDIEHEIFKLDKEPATFEFILNDKPSTDRFEFEEKSIDEIFDRPLSKEEEEIIAQKQKLRENDSLESDYPEEDEIGPEPFLVAQEDIPQAIEEPADIEETENLEPEEEVIKEPEQEEIIAAKVDEQHLTAFKPADEKVAEPAAVKLTLNDILSGKTQTEVIKAESSKPAITDLKQAISLNDKLRYIRDLFNGYNLAYAEAIDLLNKMPDFKAADAFLQNNYAAKHNWSDKQETVDHFYELLNQRFPVK